MRIKSIQVENYKSFLKSTVIEFTSGFNVIVGKNNAGKTALAEALSLNFKDKPHKSLSTMLTRLTKLMSISQVRIIMDFEFSEILEMLGDQTENIYIPISQNKNHHAEVRRFIDSKQLLIEYVIKQNNQSISTQVQNYSDHITRSGNTRCLHFQIQANELRFMRVDNVDTRSILPYVLNDLFKDRFYLFNAERLNLSESTMGVKTILEANASNLPQVLNLLQGMSSTQFMKTIV